MSRAEAEALVGFIAERASYRWRDWQRACIRYEGPGAYTVVAVNVHSRQQEIFGSHAEFQAAHQALRRATRGKQS